MRMTSKKIKDQKRLFYVVQFIELPFEGIDDYVCVPYRWLIFRSLSNKKVVVNYPNKEDPFDTKDRVKRKEKPNDEWRFYMASIKYKSDDYKDAEDWIASRNGYGPGEEESEINDTQQELMLDKKLRSASQSSWSIPISDKPQLTVKPYKNPRKPLPRISIKRPLSPKPNKNLNNKHLKLNENANPGAITDHTIIEPGCSKQEQSIIITDDKLIRQNDKTQITSAWNGKTNTEQSTQPGVIKENQSVKMAIQSTSPKLTAEFQLSPQPTTHKKMSTHLLVDRQPSQKLIDRQHMSPKILVEKQLSPIGQGYQQPLSISDVDMYELGKDIEMVSTRTPPKTLEQSTRTPPNTLEQTPQPEPVNEKSTPLVYHEHSLTDPYQREGSAEQSKEFSDSRKKHLYSILTAPTVELRPPSTVNQLSQHLKHLQSPILPVSSTLNSELRSLEYVGKNPIEVANDHQTSRSKDGRDSIPSTSYHGSNWGMLFEPVAEKQSEAGTKLRNSVDKKTRHKGGSKNITSMQYPLSSMMQFSLPGNLAVTQAAPSIQTHFRQAQVNGSLVNDVRCNMEEKFSNQKVPVFQGIVSTSPEQNSNLAHQYRSFVQASREQQYLATQADYLQQLACLKATHNRQTVAATIDRRVHHQNGIMNGGFLVPKLIDQPVQFLSRNENQYIQVNSAYAQDVIRHDQMRGPTDGAHTTFKPYVQNGVNVQLDDCYSLSQSYQNSDHPQQKQYPTIYRDPWTSGTQNDLTLKSKHYSHMPMPQKITERPRSLCMSKSPSQALLEVQRSCLLQEQCIQGKMNQNCTQYGNIIIAAVPENPTVEPAPPTQNAEVQTMTSSEIPHETQFNLIQGNHTYQLLRTNKSMVDKATETDLMMNADYCIDKIAGSSVGKNVSKIVHSACQADESLIEEQESPYQETASDSEAATEQEIESENELDSEVHEKNRTNVRNVSPEDQTLQARIISAEQDMLNAAGTLFTRMGTHLSITRDMFNYSRNSILECAQDYEIMLEKVDKLNAIRNHQTRTSSSNNETSQVLQVTQERPAGDNNNTTGIGDTVAPIREQMGKISLPVEYDPNDTKWTLKYQENKPGLVELLPRTGVYVSKKGLNRCKRQSNDCRTLARLLLTEIFSQNALSVCSLTGGKAKAFNSVNIDVRPGLDEHARLVLLAFVEKHGNKQGWDTSDTPAVISSIRTKINQIRAKHGHTCKD